MGPFFQELKRRNVFRVGIAYLVAAWLAIQVVETLFPLFGLGDTTARAVVIILAIGFIPAVILAWVFELTPEGLKRDRDADPTAPGIVRMAKRFDRMILVLLVVALGYFAVDKFVLDPARDIAREQEVTEQVRTEVLVESYGEKSIAVLPFVNMSSDSEQEFFSDGVAEEILNLLAKIPELRVISRSSAFSFKGKDLAIPEIAGRLDVAHILEGSVRKSGNRIRITAQLIEARSDTHLWSETYDRTLDDIFAIQDEIATDVVENLQITLLDPIPKSRRTNPEAYGLTLQARQMFQRKIPGHGKLMGELLDKGLALDPYYVPAMVLYILANDNQHYAGLISKEEERRRYQLLAVRILAVDPDNGFIHSMNGFTAAYQNRELEAAAEHYELAYENGRGDAEVLRQVGRFARSIGRFDKAIPILKASADLNPLCYQCLYHLSRTYLVADKLDEALATRERYVALGHGGMFHLGLIMLLKGKAEEALAVYERDDFKDNEQAIGGRAMAYYSLGRHAESDAAIAELLTRSIDEQPELAANVYAWTGDKDAAFEWLDKAQDSEGSIFFGFVFHPVYRDLHDDPRWDALRERAGVSAKRLAAIEFNVDLSE
jgi:TolB-like protein